MKVSIITATYNSAHGIEACLDSILSQDYKNIECLVIDGKSENLIDNDKIKKVFLGN